MMSGNWLHTDEAEDVAGSVRHALRCRNLIADDPQSWKWFILSLHSALQGACVCHLVGTAAPLGAVDEENQGEWLKYLEASRTDPVAPPPKTRIMNLPLLLKAVRVPGDGRYYCSPINLTDNESAFLKRFHEEFRNQFTHFAPQGWSIEISGGETFARLVARIVRDILDAGWAFRHLDEATRDALRDDLGRLAAVGT